LKRLNKCESPQVELVVELANTTSSTKSSSKRRIIAQHRAGSPSTRGTFTLFLCAPKSVGTRKSPSYLARRLATAGLQLAAAMMTRIRIIQRYTRGRFAPTPALWGASSLCRPVRVMAVRKRSNCCQLFSEFRGCALFVRGLMYPYFSVGPSREREALVCCLDGLVKSSQVNTLPKAKSKTRSKQNKDMHKCSSVYSERGVPLPVLTSGGE
jgi:hypothetical protein